MTTAALRTELHEMIDTLPDRSLPAIKPLLAYIADTDDYWKPVTELASPEEVAMIEERVRDYELDPSSFVPLFKQGVQ